MVTTMYNNWKNCAHVERVSSDFCNTKITQYSELIQIHLVDAEARENVCEPFVIGFGFTSDIS